MSSLEHDLRTQLAVIVGYAELLDTRDGESIRREAPKRILEAAERLSSALDGLAAEHEPPSLRRPQGVRRLLIADDDATVRGLLRATLSSDEFEILEAEDGGEALELAGREPLDLLLLDWRMPKRTGADVLAELKRTRPELPIVVLTASTDAGPTAEALEAAAFLVKPFSPIELLKVVERLLG